jgi:hypothetical protein
MAIVLRGAHRAHNEPVPVIGERAQRHLVQRRPLSVDYYPQKMIS